MRLFLGICMLILLTGCSGGGEPEAKKEDFSKRPPPANWRGPGDAGPPSPPSGN